MNEYLAVIEIVNSFDDRLLVIKGWAITFSLATLVVALQKKSHALLAVVVLSSLCFWILEAETKVHQSKYYARMRAIEVVHSKLILIENKENKDVCFKSKDGKYIDGPLIDWTWHNQSNSVTNTVCLEPIKSSFKYRYDIYKYPHIMVPHLVIILFCFGWFFLGQRTEEPSRILLMKQRWNRRK